MVWKHGRLLAARRSYGLRENHSGMETILSTRLALKSDTLRENHSGMETSKGKI